MLGPVFRLEMLRAARRGQHQRLRILIALALGGETAVFMLLFWSKMHPVGFLPPGPTGKDVAGAFVQEGLQWLVLQQLAVLLLIAPAQAAGSISDEKETGTLQHLLSTPLESRDIIVGKWLAHVVQVAYLWLPGVPLVLLLAGIVGLTWPERVSLVLFPLVPLPALVAGSLLASVWSRRTTSAVIRVYLVLAAVALLAWWTGIADRLGPGGVIAACLIGDGTAWRELGWFALAWVCPVVPCLVLACWRLRPAYRKQLPGQTRASLLMSGARPAVGRQPLRWKERHLGTRSLLPLPAGWTRSLGLGVVFLATALVYSGLAVASWGNPAPVVPPSLLVLGLGLSVLALAALLVAVRCAASVSAERERQTWEPLLLTPLEPRQLLRGKLWGVLDTARLYLVVYLVAALPGVALLGLEAVFWLVLTWLATWITMYFTAATGLECSVRAGSSWRALVWALLSSAWVALQRFVAFGLPVGFVCGIVAAAVVPAGWGFASGFILGCLVTTVAVLLAQAEASLELAERLIDRDERIAQGKERFRLDTVPLLRSRRA
jgi:ABC-type transport system involved in multi-copper enzyme maturation permease subunit